MVISSRKIIVNENDSVNYIAVFTHDGEEYELGMRSYKERTHGSICPIKDDGKLDCSIKNFKIELPFGYGPDNISESFIDKVIDFFICCYDSDPERIRAMIHSKKEETDRFIK